ncbi:MAG: D-tyrosyl-tRNA(Tyr) deacylase [Methanomicrobiales archaeon]|nr:D-tyrosyl-tRNA(Tyr) deacylase [Methanomicrobiales archaeon]
MKIAVINSRLDPAGCAIRGRLLELLDNPGGHPCRHGGDTLVFLETDGRLIYEEGLDARADADLILFISRHTSIQALPALTVHVTGNIGSAEYGGAPRTLARAAPAWMHALLRECAARAPAGYRVSYEVTHHGPSDIETPSLFVEIGSTEKEWRDPAAADAVAQAILAARPSATITLVGFGGNHYAARQTAIALASRGAFGHIAHSRQADDLDEEMVAGMARKSDAVAAYIDKKSVPKATVRRLEALCGDLGLPLLSESDILGLQDLSWEGYRALAACAGAAAPGSRLHPHALAGTGTAASFEIGADLLEEALKTDKDRFMADIAALPVAHLTSEEGVMLPVFCTFARYQPQINHDLITSCVKIIIRNETTAVEGDCLVIRRIRFDPRRARTAGVPAGPLFGRLAEGESVTVGGVTITPAMVSICSERIIRVPGLERYV